MGKEQKCEYDCGREECTKVMRQECKAVLDALKTLKGAIINMKNHDKNEVAASLICHIVSAACENYYEGVGMMQEALFNWQSERDVSETLIEGVELADAGSATEEAVVEMITRKNPVKH